MEHSYSKDVHPKGNVEVMATRTILIPRPPQCPSCHQTNTNDDILAKLDSQQTDPYFDQLPPPINDSIAKLAMEDTERLTRNAQNNNADDEDWDGRVNKFGWTKQQLNLYNQVSSILDYDQLAKLAVNGRQNEGIIRRCSIDKSVSRMRMALASVQWNTQITQWLHAVLCEHLSATYMTSYLDILQTLRTKCQTLVDRMIAQSPPAFNQDFLQTVLKRPYGANVPSKVRKLPGQSPIFVIVPGTLNAITPNAPQQSSRMKRWYSLFSTMASIAPIQHTMRLNQSIESTTEQLVAVTRSKIQDLRNEMPNRHIILVGVNAGASIAMQVALVETISSVVCMGFAFNTINGTRGAPDDRLLEIVTPVLFIQGENSARSSQEEIESLRERMSAQTSLVVIGSADDALRINKFNRHLEGVTQSMVDNMVADEIQDFVSTCIVNPPGPRKVPNYLQKRGTGPQNPKKDRKRKIKDGKIDKGPPRKVGRPRLNRPNETPTGQPKGDKSKATQSTPIKQTTDPIQITTQSPVSIADLPIVISEIVSSTPVGGDIVASFENKVDTNDINSIIITTEDLNNSAVLSVPPVQMPVPSPLTSTPKPFVKLAPPTGGRVQSTGVKNFFIRTGIEKSPAQPVQLAQSSQSVQSAQSVQSSQPIQPIQTLPSVQTVQPVQSMQPLQSSTIIPSPMIHQTVASNPIPPNKKIIIKSQQIIKPATTVVQESVSANTSNASSSITIGSGNNSTMDTTADLSAILDLPIMFADNDGSIIETGQSQIFNTSTTSSPQIMTPKPQIFTTSSQIIASNPHLITTHPKIITTNSQIVNTNVTMVSSPTIVPVATAIPSTSTSTSSPNIIFTPTDGKITTTRPVVIGTAKGGQKPKPTNTIVKQSPSNKVILINRNSMKPQIVTSTCGTTPTGVLKTMPTIKFLQTAVPQTAQMQQLPTNVTKLSPASKIGFPSFKLVKNVVSSTASTSAPTILRKPNQIFINKSAVIGGPGAKNAFIIKAPMTTTVPTATVQTRPLIKGNVLPNRNITVRKVVNVMPTTSTKQIIGRPPMTVSATGTWPTPSAQSSSDAMHTSIGPESKFPITTATIAVRHRQPVTTRSPVAQPTPSPAKVSLQSPAGKQPTQSPAKLLQQSPAKPSSSK